MTSSEHLNSRLSFMQLDGRARDRIKGMHDDIVAALPGALDAFYGQLRNSPETKRFFSSEQHIDGAKQRQSSHWDRIAKGEFDQNYVAAVTKVGEIHARIGLEPRWYIGGYALILEKLITDVLVARWPKRRFGSGS